MKTIYLDYAAATPIDPAVEAAMKPYWAERFYNPSGTYLSAQSVARDITEARKSVAHWFGARSSEIIFTAGGTEADNLAIRGVIGANPGQKILVSAVEHEAVLAPARQYDHDVIPVDNTGRVDLEKLASQLTDQVVLVSVMYANNEVGTIQPLRAVSKLLNQVRQSRAKRGVKTPLYLHTDACQAAGYLDLHASRLGADMITVNAGKIYGPKQVGALYIKTGVRLQPQILGGGQELNRRSGTENPAGIIGLARALELVQKNRDKEAARLEKLRDNFIKDLQKAIPNLVVNGSMEHRLPNNVHITISGQDNERLLMSLDEEGIICAAGSACSASKEEASHVLKAMGISEADAYASLRFTLGKNTTAAELKRVVKVLQGLL